ncbi:MAG TPA: hypothetical protein VHA33_12390 [Candidatus Angelobacter sp.]|nr:hypothetical protein [Candidatus Angelobacter sp.]
METRLTENKPSSTTHDKVYATGLDFCRIFKEDMKNLYLLSLLLTADPEKAEQCFVAGLDDCVAHNQVFEEWARSWARRAIIKNAIRLIAPQPAGVNSVPKDFTNQLGMELQAQFSLLLGLPSFERFAFVMSVLEGYSERECTLLLGCTRADLMSARSEALRKIADGDEQAVIELKPEQRSTSFELQSPVRLATPA